MDIRIRKFKPEDTNHLFNICRVTANDRYSASQHGMGVVTVLYCSYFLREEPQNIFVAVNKNDIPVGYILCSFGEKKFFGKMLGKYARLTLKFGGLKYLPDCLLEVLTLKLLPKKYRTHLHIDILPEYQRKGIGTMLVDALRQYLWEQGKENLTVASIGKNTLGYKFYTKYGFKEVKNFGFGEVAVSVPTAGVTANKEA